MTSIASRISAWNRRLDDPVDMRALAVLRIALGPIVILHLSPFLADASRGVIYRDTFTLPYTTWWPELPQALYIGLLWGLAIGAIALSLGLWTRTAAWFVSVGVAYNLLLSQTHFHHNRAFLVILLFGSAVLPLGRTVSIDAWRAHRAGRPLDGAGGSRLALTVLRFEIATVYLASGVSKLLDGDWWAGTVTRLRVERYEGRLHEVGVPDGVIDVLLDPMFQSVAAKAIIATELLIGVGVSVPRLRKLAIWFAIPFHVAIQLTAAVQVFSFAALAALVVWIDRPSRDRRIDVGDRWASVIRVLDWTGRFDIRATAAPLTVVDGSRTRHGWRARWFVLSRLPLTFWFAAPVLLVRR